MLEFDFKKYLTEFCKRTRLDGKRSYEPKKPLEAARKAAIKLKKLSDADHGVNGRGRHMDMLKIMEDEADVHFETILSSAPNDKAAREKSVADLKKLLFGDDDIVPKGKRARTSSD